MLLSTFSDASFVLVLSISGIAVALAVAGFLIVRVIRGNNLAVRILCGVSALLVGGGGLVVGGAFLLFGLILWGCPPDAEECLYS